MKYEKTFREYFSKVNLFTFKDARRFLKKLGASDAYIKLFVHVQREKHGLMRLSKGNYTFANSGVVAGFAFRPFYYGMEYSLTIHKIWTQVAIPVIITANRVRPGSREVAGYKVFVRRISQRMFFGIEYIKYGGVFVPVSDPEKTLIDFIYFNVALNKGDMENLIFSCNIEKLKRYSRLCNARVRKHIKKLIASQSE